KLAVPAQLGGWREVKQRLELAHHVDLASALKNVHALLGGDHRVTVKVSRALLKLGEVLNGLERTLASEQPLDVHSAQRRGIDAMTVLLRADVADKVRRGVGVAVDVAVKAGHSK